MSGMFKSRSSTTTLDPMLTEEQKQAQKVLSSLATTGSYGGLNLGDAYTGSLGDFDMTSTEGLAGNKLYELLGAATPGIDTARSTLTNLANTQFNPDDPSSGYAAYARQVARATGEANDALNRDAAITGDRFSTSLGRDKVSLRDRQGDMLASKLAELFNSAQNRSLNAAQGLGNLETQNNAIQSGRINDAFQFGSLQRDLKNAEAMAKFSEWDRARSEKLKQFDVANNLFGRNVNFGEMSKTTKAPSIFMSMLGQFSPLAGAYNTAKYGADAAPGQAGLGDAMKAFSAATEGGGSNKLMSLLKSLAMGAV